MTLLALLSVATAASVAPAPDLYGTTCRFPLIDTHDRGPVHQIGLHPVGPERLRNVPSGNTRELEFTATPAISAWPGIESPKRITMPHPVMCLAAGAPEARRIFIASRDEARGVTRIDVLSVDLVHGVDERGVATAEFVGPTVRRVAETTELAPLETMSYVPWTNTLVVVERTDDHGVLEFDLDTGHVTPLPVEHEHDWRDHHVLVRPYGEGGSLTLFRMAGCSLSSEVLFVDPDDDGTWDLPDDAARAALPAYPQRAPRWRDPGS